MGTFYTNPASVPFEDKVPKQPLKVGQDPRNYPLAKDLNALKGALLDLRAAMRAGLRTLVAGTGIAIDASTAGQATISLASEAWRLVGAASQPAFQNSWVNYGAPNATAAFYRDAGGRVHLRGVVKSGTVGAIIFNLPSGYRPSDGLNYFSSIGQIVVGAGGDVYLQSGSNTAVGLDGISFRSEQ